MSRSRQSRLRLITRTQELAPVTNEPADIEPGDSGSGEGQLWTLALRDLGPEASSALWLRYVEDLSPKEIGAVLGKTGGSVRVMLHRARQRLLDSLGEETIERLAGSQQWSRGRNSQGRAHYAECGT